MFSFASNKRKPTPLRDNISNPLSPAETKQMEARTADDDSRSLYFARERRAEQLARIRPSLPSADTYYDAESQSNPTKSARPQRLQKRPAKPERPVEPRTVPDVHQHQLKKEKSSSTLRSYYDRRKSPLAVSQQTSASSARDFALRKGCPPAVPKLLPDMSGPQNSENAPSTNRAEPKKRPSRLDFSMLFPKPLPRSRQLLSPRRFTHSPPPLSITSELPCNQPESQTFLHDRRASEAQDSLTTYPTQGSGLPLRTKEPSNARTNVQKPRPEVQNWFDGVEGEISKDEADYEPEMQPDFIENAFQKTCSKVTPEIPFRPRVEPDKAVEPGPSTDDQSSRWGKGLISPKPTDPEDGQVRRPSHTWEATTKSASEENSIPMNAVRGSSYVILDRSDLHEQSVLCLSSSDDEDDNVLREDQRRILEHRGPFLRDSLGIDSIDSDVEIGTAQAVTTSFLRTSEPMVKSRSLRGSSSMKGKIQSQRLKAIEIPDRRSSRQGVSRNNHRMVLPSSNDGIMSAASIYPVEGGPFSNKILARKEPAAVQSSSPLMMALTPQEATLLAAMRSKRASMRQNLLTEAHRLAADEGSSYKAIPVLRPSLGLSADPRSFDNRPARPVVGSLKARQNFSTNTTSTESSLPSGRVSLIFSESLSSPTTGRDSPATPIMDATPELNVLHGLQVYHDPGIHTVNANQYGHAQCRTGSDSIIVLENFLPPQKESMASEEYPWMFRGLTERASPTMIH
jgi:hypothetical protein